MVVLAVQKTADVIVDKVAAIALGSARLALIVANGAPGTSGHRILTGPPPPRSQCRSTMA